MNEPESAASQGEASVVDNIEPGVSQIRPWIRYWARSIDITLFSFTAGLVLGFLEMVGVPDPFLGLNDFVFGVVWLLMFAFVEPLFLEKWGTTPGKALLSIHVRKATGENLSYRDGLERSIRVYVQGLGVAIPIVTFFTVIFSYIRLTKHKATLWDAHGNFIVQHGRVSGGKVFAAIAIMVLALVSVIFVSVLEGMALYGY